MDKPSPVDATQFLRDRYVGDDPERVAGYERALADAHVARDIYRLRKSAGLTQRELALRVGTTASVISRLEDADYDGHSLSMLRRIAAALGMRAVIQFVSIEAPVKTKEIGAAPSPAAQPDEP
jgi:ribosome-binding protein aMBF1 (putative translation factor)